MDNSTATVNTSKCLMALGTCCLFGVLVSQLSDYYRSFVQLVLPLRRGPVSSCTLPVAV